MVYLVIQDNGCGNFTVLWASEKQPDWSKIDWPSMSRLTVSIVTDGCHIVSNQQYDVYLQDDIDKQRAIAQSVKALKHAASIRFGVHTPREILDQRDGRILCRDVQYKIYKATIRTCPPPDTYQAITIRRRHYCTVTRPFHSNQEAVAVEWEDMKAALRSFARDGYDLRLSAPGSITDIEEYIAEIESESCYYTDFIDVIHPGQMAEHLTNLLSGDYDISSDDGDEPF